MKVIDFGSARRVTPGERVTVDEPRKGAEEFAAPELLLKTPISKQSDIW
jgi:serine/threonine protein kinase